MTLNERVEATMGKLLVENMSMAVQLEKLQGEYNKVRAEYDACKETPSAKPPVGKPNPASVVK